MRGSPLHHLTHMTSENTSRKMNVKPYLERFGMVQ